MYFRPARLKNAPRESRRTLSPSIGLCLLVAFTLQGCLILDLRPLGRPGDVRKADLPKVSEVEGDRVYSLIGPDSIPAGGAGASARRASRSRSRSLEG